MNKDYRTKAERIVHFQVAIKEIKKMYANNLPWQQEILECLVWALNHRIERIRKGEV
jgi:hypothetical protein